jgi:hypothetical protein
MHNTHPEQISALGLFAEIWETRMMSQKDRLFGREGKK